MKSDHPMYCGPDSGCAALSEALSKPSRCKECTLDVCLEVEKSHQDALRRQRNRRIRYYRAAGISSRHIAIYFGLSVCMIQRITRQRGKGK